MIWLAGALAYVGACAWLALDLAEESEEHRAQTGGLRY